ncbi:LysM peptidoglycan-binding domain-containing protein [Flavobacterium sp.]|uniref:lytic transglycosylase n=1 Tax=Flavobacterium sp. TaxID=239 RepID=UPI00286E03F5|nr:LysM peptidoglycan-binding domain-containing protein [Flavobacterium sp.]
MKYLSLFFLCLSNFVFAQQEQSISHKVTKGETIYQISKKYNVTPDEIYKINPDAEKGLPENAILIIPNNQSFSYNLKKSNIAVNTNFGSHIVQTKETLYGISKQYNVSIEDLEKLNSEVLKEGIKSGQNLQIPEKKIQKEVVKSNLKTTNENTVNSKNHIVKPKETLFSIARLFNVSVDDLDKTNAEILLDGLQIGEIVTIPNKKKTLNGQARIINSETVFHIVEPKETKFSIAKKYGISQEQLEIQNPEIVNGLIIGNKLAINTKQIKAKNDNEELMIALAEKQVAIEKSKAKTLEIEDLQDKLTVQKQMNQKVLKVNSLKVNLNAIDETKGGSAEKLKLVLEANKNIQEILISKLDSLVVTMSDDLELLKTKEIDDLEQSKQLEKESYKNIGQTNSMLQLLKKDLADNRKIYTGLMFKVQKISFDENREYKKKVRENQKNNLDKNDLASIEAIGKIKEQQETNDKRNELLLTKIDSIVVEKNIELKRRIGKASFYSAEARDYDDKLAQAKLKRYQKKAVETQNENQNPTTVVVKTREEIRKELSKDAFDQNAMIKIEVLNAIKDVSNGYYVVADVFTEAKPRDELAMKLTDSGEINTNFFYNVGVFSYYVYTKTFDNVDEALYECKQKSGKLLYEKMFIVQIKND